MLNTAKNFLSEVVSLGLLLIAVGVVLQVIFGSAVPFVGGDIVANLTGLIGSLGAVSYTHLTLPTIYSV